jgi:hypothetical protein
MSGFSREALALTKMEESASRLQPLPQKLLLQGRQARINVDLPNRLSTRSTQSRAVRL